MAYGICRIVKLKSGGAIAASESHTLRQRETPNADLSRENERFIGSELGRAALEQEVFDRIGNQKIRKDGVLCVEILLTASPEYFRPGDRGRAGLWDSQQLEDWKQTNQDWLSEKFGDRLVRAELHLDESTPHIHAYLVPLDEKGKLNCKSIFGGREKLSLFQDSYATAMKPLGLERGIRGSRATHTEVKEYYAAVVKEPDLSLTPAEIHHQLADRQRVIKAHAEMEQTAKDLAQENHVLEERLRRVQILMEQQQQDLFKAQDNYRVLTGKLRSVPLVQVAYELGLDADLQDQQKWRNESYTIHITGEKFYDWQSMKGGGGAIDLVMHVERCGFTDAVGWLGDRFGGAEAIQIVTRQVAALVEEKPQQPFVAPVPEEKNWGQVRDELTRRWMLPRAIVDQLHRDGLVYADDLSHAVFLRRNWDGNVTGAVLQEMGAEGRLLERLAGGTRRSRGWFYTVSGGEDGAAVERVVLVRGAIDGMSYQVLHPPEVRTMVLAIDGVGHLPLAELEMVKEVAIAFDRGDVGMAIGQRLQGELPDSERQLPKNKDWNKDLQEQIQEMQRQFRDRQKPQDLEQKRDKGVSL
jgi:hypothetical protein